MEGKVIAIRGIKEMSWFTQISTHMDSIDDWLMSAKLTVRVGRQTSQSAGEHLSNSQLAQPTQLLISDSEERIRKLEDL